MSERSITPGTIAILLVAMLFMTGVAWGAVTRLTPLSPISSYQGIHPSFVAVWDEGLYYTTSVTNEASVCRIGPASMNFDPDKPAEGLPNLQGELRDIQIVRDLSQYVPEATMSHIINSFGGNPQPDTAYRVYEWEVLDGDDKHIYRMELWLCTMEINLWVKPDWNPLPVVGEIQNRRYRDTEVWIRLEASNEWDNYFVDVGVDNTYFGLAYLELAEVTGTPDDPALQIIPMARWSAFDIYDDVGGSGQTPAPPDSQAYRYEGDLLSETVFKSDWYTKITLSNFGTYDYQWLDGSYKSDTVQVKALAHIFVVGEWIVKPDQERDLEEHEPPWVRGWYTSFVDGVNTYMSNPWNRLKLTLGLTVFILAFGVFMYPPLLGHLIRGAKAVESEGRKALDSGKRKRRK